MNSLLFLAGAFVLMVLLFLAVLVVLQGDVHDR